MYSEGVTGHDVAPFASISRRRHLFFALHFAKVKVVKRKGNVNFSEDYKRESQRKKAVFDHPPLSLSK